MLYNSAGDTPYNRAVAAEESKWRSLAWIPEPWTIAGKEVRVMTVSDYRTLILMRSPVICGGDFSEEAVAQFLWFLSPEYSADPVLRGVFLLEVFDKLRGTRDEIDEFLDFHLLDEPPSCGGGRKIGISYVASLVHALASSYGWEPSIILNLPLPQVFQLLKLIRHTNDPKTPDFKSSDKDDAIYLQYVNSLPPEEAAEIISRVDRGETIEIPDEWLHHQS